TTPPSGRVTEAAKNSIKNKKSVFNGLKGALIAAAGVVSACATAIVMYFTPSAIGGLIDAGNKGGSSGAAQQIHYYDQANLAESPLDIYAHGAPQGIDFMKNIYLASNCSVNSVNAYYSGENIAYVKAEITASVNSCRHETVIYAEYAEENTACELFREYYGGDTAYYDGHVFLYLDTEDNGEYVKKMVIEKNGVNYYVCVTSSDVFAYRMWLDLILK
ncbi:MAG: hypothetical protein K2K04_00990, partial [Clostridia bacterium]|nr:hypothetical protein [Clostridia bacterium]